MGGACSVHWLARCDCLFDVCGWAKQIDKLKMEWSRVMGGHVASDAVRYTGRGQRMVPGVAPGQGWCPLCPLAGAVRLFGSMCVVGHEHAMEPRDGWACSLYAVEPSAWTL